MCTPIVTRSNPPNGSIFTSVFRVLSPYYLLVNSITIRTTNVMKLHRLATLGYIAVAGMLLVSCSKETPRQEKKPNETTKPVVPETPKIPGEAHVAVATPGGLEAALKGEDLAKLTKLVVRSGTLNQADLDYVTKSLKIQEIDLSAATLSLGEKDKGFDSNSTLKKITAPANIEKTQKAWFSNTLATELVFPGDKLKSFGGAVYNEKLKSIVLPNSVEELGVAAFANSNFETITLSTSLKSIPAEAFKGCRRLTKLTIPASVAEIKDNVFAACAKLKEIVFLCPTPKFTANELDENAFEGYDFTAIEPKITVPKGMKADYLKALGWGPKARSAQWFVEAE